MASNSQEIIQDIRGQFEHMLEFVTGEEARTATADHIERGLFKMVLRSIPVNEILAKEKTEVS
jgi:hypothetical protein